jgi:hypothetical protein
MTKYKQIFEILHEDFFVQKLINQLKKIKRNEQRK